MAKKTRWYAIGVALVAFAGIVLAASAIPIPGSATLEVGQAQMFATASIHVEIVLDGVGKGSAHIGIDGGPNCDAASACPESVPGPQLATLSLNQSIDYAGITLTLTALTATSATFSATEKWQTLQW